MRVRLKHLWFVGGRRLRPGDHEMPDELRAMLPSSAVVLEGQFAVADKKAPTEPSPDHPMALSELARAHAAAALNMEPASSRKGKK